MNKSISLVLPIFNEEATITELYKELLPVLHSIEDEFTVEVIFVNDGSSDTSGKLLNSIQIKDNRVNVLHFSRNFGHQVAVTAGLDFAKGDAVIVMDSDLQDPPSLVLKLISKWKKGYEVVYAKRKSRKDTFMKKLTAYIFYRVLDKLSDVQIPKDTGDFRLLDRKVVDELKRFPEHNRYIRGLVSYVGFRQIGVEFDRSERFAGKSNYTFKKMVKLALDGITGFSTSLLTLIFQLGLVLILIGSISILLFLSLIIFHVTIPLMISLLAIGFLFSGLQLVMLSIVGIYVGRIYNEVQNRPLYIIDSINTNIQKHKTSYKNFQKKTFEISIPQYSLGNSLSDN